MYLWFCLGVLLLLCQSNFAQKPELVTPVVTNDGIDYAALSPDEKYMIGSVLGSGKGVSEIKVWDARSTRLLYTLPNHFLPSNSHFFNHEGTQLLSSDERVWRLWALQTGKAVAQLEGLKIEYASFARDGSLIYGSGSDSTIHFWSKNGVREKRFTGYKAAFYPLYLHPNKRMLIGVSGTRVFFIDAASGEVKGDSLAAKSMYKARWSSFYDRNTLREGGFAGGGRWWVGSYYDSTLFVWDCVRSERVTLPQGWVDVAFSDGSNRIALLAEKGVQVYDLESKQTIYEDRLKAERVGLSADGTKLLLHWSDYETGDPFTLWRSLPDGKILDKVPTASPATRPPELIHGDRYLQFIDFEKGKERIVLQALKGTLLGRQTLSYSARSQTISTTTDSSGKFLAIVSGDSSVRVWDLERGRIAARYPVHDARVNLTTRYIIDVHPERRKNEGGFDTVVLTNWVTGKVESRVPIPQDTDPFLSPDHEYLIVDKGMMDSDVYIYHPSTGKRIASLKKPNGNPIQEVVFLPGERAAFKDQIADVDLEFYNLRTGKREGSVQHYQGETFSLYENALTQTATSYDGVWLATKSRQQWRLWNLQTRQSRRLTTTTEFMSKGLFTPDGRYFVYSTSEGTIYVRDMKDFKEVVSLKGHSSYITFLQASGDGKRLISQEEKEGKVHEWDLTNFKLARSLSLGETFNVLHCDFTKNLLHTAAGPLIRLQPLDKPQALYSFALFEGEESMVMLHDGYYSATPSAAIHLSWKVGEKLYPFDQFDITYNRPDLVAAAMPLPDTAVFTLYSQAYARRMKRLGLTEKGRDGLPNITITKPLPLFTHADSVEITFSQKERVSPPGYQVWINNNPLALSKRTDRNANSQVLTVPLTPGLNKIQIGTEKEGKEVQYITYDTLDSPPDSRFFFIGIGVDNYKDKRYNLSYCTKDIRDLDTLLKMHYGGMYESRVLLNDAVTKEQVIALKDFLLQSRPHDKVVVAFAGHGLLTDSLDYYLATYGIDFKKPELAGLPYEYLERLLEGIPAMRKLLLVDACHSGELDEKGSKSGTLSSKVKATGRGILPDEETDGQNSQLALEAMKTLFADLSRGNGAVVVAAAGGQEFAYEDQQYNNGIFTFALKRGLLEGSADRNGDQKITVLELKEYVRHTVSELTGGMQRPTTRRENLEWDWVLW